MYRGHKGQ